MRFNLAESILLANIWKQNFYSSILIERNNSQDTQFGGVVRNFFSNSLKQCKKNVKDVNYNVNPENIYDWFALYVAELSKSNEEIRKIYNESVSTKKYNISVSLELGDDNTRKKGKTYSNEDNGELKIVVYILPKEYNIIIDALNNGYVPYDYIRKLISAKKGTLVHELTHYFQGKSGKLNISTIKKIEVMEKFRSIQELSFYFYLLQDHEIEARARQAFNIYKTKTNYQKRTNERTKSYLQILLEILIKSLDNISLENNIVDNDEINTLNMIFRRGRMFDMFYIAWFVYHYIANHIKYKHFVEINNLPTPPNYINLNIIKNNKINIDNFLEQLSIDEIEKLNKLLPKTNPMATKENLFSINRDNSNYIENIINTLKF